MVQITQSCSVNNFVFCRSQQKLTSVQVYNHDNKSKKECNATVKSLRNQQTVNKNLRNEKEDEIVNFFPRDTENGRNDTDGRDILIKIYCSFFFLGFVDEFQ